MPGGGERHDRDAGLIYLNARYMDPELGMFTQPDWFEVTEPGVGTNRYAYSFNDPVNLRDPGGNISEYAGSTLAEDSYEEESNPERLAGDWRAVTEDEIVQLGIERVIFVNADSGFQSRLYYSAEANEYAFAFAGTQDVFGPDMQTNIEHGATGMAWQHRYATSASMAVSHAVQGSKLSFVGHSLGGGLAVTGAAATGNGYDSEIKVYNSAHISARVADGGKFTNLQNYLSSRHISTNFGQSFSVVDPLTLSPFGLQVGQQVLVDIGGFGGGNHSISTLVDALQ